VVTNWDDLAELTQAKTSRQSIKREELDQGEVVLCLEALNSLRSVIDWIEQDLKL